MAAPVVGDGARQSAEAAPLLGPVSCPEPRSSCPSVEASDLMQLLENDAAAVAGAQGSSSNRDFLLVDVRRTDWEGGTVATSINLPEQSFYQTRPAVYRLCKQAGIKRVIFYCGSCSGRGPRCAGWMQDYLDDVGETNIQAFILKGGIKGWHRTYGGRMMDSYDEKFWDGKK